MRQRIAEPPLEGGARGRQGQERLVDRTIVPEMRGRSPALREPGRGQSQKKENEKTTAGPGEPPFFVLAKCFVPFVAEKPFVPFVFRTRT
jgi:hypothetical protein